MYGNSISDNNKGVTNRDNLPQFNDQVCRDPESTSVIAANVTNVYGDSNKSSNTLTSNVAVEELSYKDQVRESRGDSTKKIDGIVDKDADNEKSGIGTVIDTSSNRGPSYKDQARSRGKRAQQRTPTLHHITEETSQDFIREGSSIVVAVDSTNSTTPIVNAHLVPDSPNVGISYQIAEIIDTRKENLRTLLILTCAIVAVAAIAIVPIYFLAIKDIYNDVQVLTAAPTNSLPFTSSPSVSPSISYQPSVSPTMYDRFYTVGEPIATDILVDDNTTTSKQSIVASLSWNGSFIAVGNNNTIIVYQQQISSGGSNSSSWLQVGESLIVDVNQRIESKVNDNYYTFHLAPNALVIAVGTASFQGNTGRVDVYEYNSIIEKWVKRGNSLRGNTTDQFGYQVVLSNDGTYMGVAASNYDEDKSYAEVLEWNVTSKTWQLLGRIDGPGHPPDLSISLSESTIILGDPNDGIVGKAEVYECSLIEGCNRVGPTLEGPDYEDFFGADVSISGSKIAIASPGIVECRELCANVKVYEFGRGTEEVWSTVGQELFGPIGFGKKVVLSSSNTLAILNITERFSGDEVIEIHTHLYRFDGSLWLEIGTLPLGLALLDMSSDGNTIATTQNGTVVVHTLADYLIV